MARTEHSMRHCYLIDGTSHLRAGGGLRGAPGVASDYNSGIRGKAGGPDELDRAAGRSGSGRAVKLLLNREVDFLSLIVRVYIHVTCYMCMHMHMYMCMSCACNACVVLSLILCCATGQLPNAITTHYGAPFRENSVTGCSKPHAKKKHVFPRSRLSWALCGSLAINV